MRSRGGRVPLSRREAAQLIAFGSAYALLGWLSFAVVAPPVGLPAIWLCNGLALGVLIRTPRAAWPRLVFALFVGRAAVLPAVAHSVSPVPVLGVTLLLCDTFESAFGAWLVVRAVGPSIRLDRLKEVAALTGFGVLLAPLVASLVASLALVPVKGVSFTSAVSSWWFPDALGNFVAAPLVLTWPAVRASRPSATRVWTEVGTLAALALLFFSVFGLPDEPLRFLLLAFLTFPLLGWVALQSGPRGAATAALVVGAVALGQTLAGRGPFASIGSLERRVEAVQGFFALGSLSALVLAAVVEERRRAERQVTESYALLDRSEKRFRSLAQASAQVVWTTDSQWRFLEEMPSWTHFTGQRPEEALGYGYLDRVHLDDRARVLDVIEHAIARPAPLMLECRLRRRDGTWRDLEVRAVPVRDPSGEVREWVGMDFDISERKEAEKERARLYRELEEALQVRDDFLSIASHELKTPLTPLSIRLQSLQRQVEAHEPVSPEALQKARSSLDRLASLINELLDVSRIQARRLSHSAAPTSLTALVRAQVAEVAPTTRRHEFELVAPEEDLWVTGDSARLEQVLSNLLDNAIKYSPSGGRIRVTLETRADEHVLSVQDFGIGIPADQQQRIFERFARARNVGPTHYGGLGLGLYISRDIVERHGGRIWVQSEEGHGSTFFVALPRLEPGDARETRTGARPAATVE